ncbi:aldo/keto reductase [Microbacterium sp. A8/3-1]|uniref:Aldo/keto reductase n=1 Tax=Microbacterium sp. A8/3-1 TaxID=3160749 RepID=A0AAU7W3J8_9MICO
MSSDATASSYGPLALGTMTFGDTVDPSDAGVLLDRALGAGVTMIDTANGYAGGATESILGDLLAGRRDDVVLATKAGIPHPDADGRPPLSREGLRASLEGSLRRLRTDHVDLFYLHQPDRETPLDETLSVIGELRAEGKIIDYGVSNFAAWQIAQIDAAADAQGIPRPRVAQQVYSVVARRIEEEYREFAATTGLSTMVYNPLSGGLLSGRHHLDERPSDGRFGDSRLAAMYTERYWNAEMFEAIADLARIADDSGLPLPELALRWLLGRPGVDTILLGASRLAHLDANLAAVVRGPLAADTVAACDEIGSRLRGPMPAYNR